MTNKVVRYIAVLCVLSVLLAGCAGNIRTAVHRSEIRAKGTVLFVPLGHGDIAFYDSPDGTAIARDAAEALLTHARGLRPVDAAALRGPVRAAFLESPEGVAWEQIALEAGADYVVYGNINELSWKDKLSPSINRCNFTVTYHVYDARAGEEIYSVRKMGIYPSSAIGNWGLTTPRQSALVFRAQSHAYIGRVIASTFFTYKTPRREEESVTVIRLD